MDFASANAYDDRSGVSIARVDRLVGIYEIPHVSHIYVIYSAQMTSPDFAPGLESEEVDLFAWSDIPWDELAFASVTWALKQYRQGDLAIVHEIHQKT